MNFIESFITERIASSKTIGTEYRSLQGVSGDTSFVEGSLLHKNYKQGSINEHRQLTRHTFHHFVGLLYRSLDRFILGLLSQQIHCLRQTAWRDTESIRKH